MCVLFLDFCLFGLFFLPILKVQQATPISLLFKTGSLFNEIPPWALFLLLISGFCMYIQLHHAQEKGLITEIFF